MYIGNLGMNEHYPFVNPPLPYAYDALEPCIDTKTMCLHHDRHLQTYVNNLNDTLKNCPELQCWSLEKLLCNASSLNKDTQTSIRHNGGGVYNHIFYFNGMSNSETRSQAGMLYYALVENFGSIENFFNEFRVDKLMSKFINTKIAKALPKLSRMMLEMNAHGILIWVNVAWRISLLQPC